MRSIGQPWGKNCPKYRECKIQLDYMKLKFGGVAAPWCAPPYLAPTPVSFSLYHIYALNDCSEIPVLR